MIEIFIPGKPPTATAQQKGRTRSGVWYKPAKLKAAEDWYMWGLTGKTPPAPLSGPIVLRVDFIFQASREHKAGTPKITRPDTDNMVKLLKDCLTHAGFWEDDAQVFDETIIKYYDHEPGVRIFIRRLGE